MTDAPKRGRPRLPLTRAENLTIRIPPALRRALERDAVARRESIGEYTRAAIRARIESREADYEEG